MFKKYQHLERLGTGEVDGIELGTCHIFPKIDGTNSSVWIEDGEIKAGSRRRELSLDSDNAGFYNYIIKDENIKKYLKAHPEHILFGEFLVPHALKTYRDDSWRKFYVFDVAIEIDKIDEFDDVKFKYLSYDEYSKDMDVFNIEYIPRISTIIDGSKEQFYSQLEKNDYLIKDGEGCGEGIVIKNYSFVSKYGRTTWAKLVTSEFKEKHNKVNGGSKIEGTYSVEKKILDKYCTTALIEKEYSKLIVDCDWESKMIPRLLNTIYYNIIKEDCWNFIKEYKNPTIDFKLLKGLVDRKIKENKSELF